MIKTFVQAAMFLTFLYHDALNSKPTSRDERSAKPAKTYAVKNRIRADYSSGFSHKFLPTLVPPNQRRLYLRNAAQVIHTEAE